MKKVLALLAGGSMAAFALPATAQEVNSAFTGPRVEALIGYDNSRPGSSEDIDNAEDINQSLEDSAYGVGVGFDMGFRGALVGVEGEYIQSDAQTDYDTAGFTQFGVSNIGVGRDLYAGVRAGILATPSTLVYVKGGYTNARYNVLTSDNRSETGTNIDLDGWRVGAGAEHALTDNLFVKAEYRYSNYKKGEVEGPSGLESDRFDIDADRHQVMAGVGLRF